MENQLDRLKQQLAMPGVSEHEYLILEREHERLSEDLEELRAREYAPLNPGCTDESGARWDFVQHSGGRWVALHVSEIGVARVLQLSDPNHVSRALRAWLRETGRR